MSLTLVTNRTTGAKYNAADLNRVESAVATLAAALNAAGYSVAVTTKTDWTRTDLGQLDAQATMERYRANIATIRAVLTVMATTPTVPTSMRFLGYQSANDIEQILLDVEMLIDNMAFAARHSGAATCGMGGLIR